ncbi:MAG: SRPBCC family protein [Gammaproteobacteria bacterium]
MYKVLVEKTIDLPRKRVFELLVDFGGIEKILPDMVASCGLTGSGVGAVRTVIMKDGGTVVERLDAAHDDSVFAYSMTANDALPVENYFALVSLSDDGDKTIARWGSNWDAKGATDAELVPMFEELYTTLIDGLPSLA